MRATSAGLLQASDEGVAQAIRQVLDFRGAGVAVTPDAVNPRELDVIIPGGSGAQVVTRRTVAAPYTVLSDDHELWVTSAGTITIPVAQNSDGRRLVIKHRVAAGGTVSVAPAGGGTIDGAATYDLLVLHESVGLTGDGTNWGRNA